MPKRNIIFVVIVMSMITLNLVVTKNHHRTKKEATHSLDSPWDQQWDSPELKFEEDYVNFEVDPHGHLYDETFNQEEEKTRLEDEWTETKKSRMESLENMSTWADCEERDTCYSSYELPFAARNCFCDPHCIVYNDCCPDSPALMDGKPPGLPNITSDSLSCQKLENVNSDAEFYVVNRCPASYRDEYVRRRCEQVDENFTDLFFKVYVSSEKSEILYRNVYCAICHGENKRLRFWQVVRDCPLEQDDELLTVEPSLSSFQKLETKLKESCKLELMPPSYVLPRKCKSHVSNCLENWANERDVGLCQGGSTSYVYTKNETFKNKYCAVCNGQDENTLSCKDSSSNASQFDFSFSEDAAAKPTSLWLITDLSDAMGHIRTPTHFGHPVKLGKCRETGQVFDPFRKPEVCRRIRCDDDGFKFWAGKCIEKFKTSILPSTLVLKTSKKPPTKARTKSANVNKVTQQTIHEIPEIFEIKDDESQLKTSVVKTSFLHTTTTTQMPVTLDKTTTQATSMLFETGIDLSDDIAEEIPDEGVDENGDETKTSLSSVRQDSDAYVDSYDLNVNYEELFRQPVVTSNSKSTSDHDDDYHISFRETPPLRGVRKRKPTTPESPIGEANSPFPHDFFDEDMKSTKDSESYYQVKLQVPSTVNYEVVDHFTPSHEFQHPVLDSSTFSPRHPKKEHSSVKHKGKPSHQACMEYQIVEEHEYHVFDNNTVLVFALGRFFEQEDVSQLRNSDGYQTHQGIEVCLRRSDLSSELEESPLDSLNVTALEPLVDLLIMFHYDRPQDITSLILTIIALVGLLGTIVGLSLPSLVRKTLTMKCVLSLCLATFMTQCLYLCSSIISNLGHPEGIDSAKIHMNKPVPVNKFCFWNGVLLHYFVLAIAFWLNAFVIAFAKKGGNLEKKSAEEEIKLNSQDRKQKHQDGYLFYSLYAWLSPLAIVVVSMVVDLTGGNSFNSASIRPFYGQYQVCWMTGQNALWLFLAFPISILTVVNLVLLITTGVKKLRNSQGSDRSPLQRFFKHKLVFGIVFTVNFFLAWLFAFLGGYLHRNDYHHTFVWFLFIIFNFLTAGLLHLVFFSCRFMPRILGREATFNLHSTDELTPSSSNPDTLKTNGHDNLAARDKLMFGEASSQETPM